jgi:hypothetical protein
MSSTERKQAEDTADASGWGGWSLVAALATIVAAFGFGWAAAKDQISDELNTLKSIRSLDLSGTLDSLRTLSATLNSQVVERNEVERLKEAAQTSSSTIKSLSEETATLKANNERLRVSLKAYEGNAFELPLGQPRFLIKNRIALTASQRFTDSCWVQVGTNSGVLNVGAHTFASEGGATKRITLLGVTPTGCRFVINDE